MKVLAGLITESKLKIKEVVELGHIDSFVIGSKARAVHGIRFFKIRVQKARRTKQKNSKGGTEL